MILTSASWMHMPWCPTLCCPTVLPNPGKLAAQGDAAGWIHAGPAFEEYSEALFQRCMRILGTRLVSRQLAAKVQVMVSQQCSHVLYRLLGTPSCKSERTWAG
jgi:hypothetical protein